MIQTSKRVSTPLGWLIDHRNRIHIAFRVTDKIFVKTNGRDDLTEISLGEGFLRRMMQFFPFGQPQAEAGAWEMAGGGAMAGAGEQSTNISIG